MAHQEPEAGGIVSSAIEWTDETWNPVTGCSKVSPGCEHCYAETVARRFDSEWRPWTAPNAAHNVRLHPERLAKPLHWRKPRRVFVNSMSDFFHEQVPDEFIDRVFAVMALTPQHTYQILTKRPERMREYLSDHERADCIGSAMEAITGRPVSGDPPDDSWDRLDDLPLPNVWCGTSVEDQRRADERLPPLLATLAAGLFVSCEPLLGPVDLTCVAPIDDFWTDALDTPDPTRRLSWVIVGGESGPGARPCDIEWIRSIVRQCKAAGVGCFTKQIGAKPFTSNLDGIAAPFGVMRRSLIQPDGTVHFFPRDHKGGDPEEWPADLRVREFPAPMG